MTFATIFFSWHKSLLICKSASFFISRESFTITSQNIIVVPFLPLYFCKINLFFLVATELKCIQCRQKRWLLFSTNYEKNNLQYCDSINIIITEARYIVELMDLKNETWCHLFIFISHTILSSCPPCIDYSVFLSSFFSHFSYIIVLENFKHQDI